MSLVLLPLALLRPTHTVDRTTADFYALVDSIRRQGVLQPILATLCYDDTYTVVKGNRRVAAAQLAGLTEIPALVKPLTATQILEAQLLDAAPEEQARLLRELLVLEPNRSKAQLALLVGQSAQDFDKLLGLDWLIPEAHDVPLANACQLCKLSAAQQRQLLEQARTLPAAEFAVVAKDHRAQAQSRRQAARDHASYDYINKPRLRPLRELRSEHEQPWAAYRLVTPDMTPAQAFAMAIAWAICLDPESLRQRTAADAARQRRIQQQAKERNEERHQKQEYDRQGP